MVNYKPEENLGLELPPKGKHLFGVVTVGDKGQIVIPAIARKIFDIKSGDQLVVLGDESQGIAVVKISKQKLIRAKVQTAPYKTVRTK